MKKIIIPLFTFVALGLSAQSIDRTREALDINAESLNGTARFRGMAGSMGALGSDLSAVSVNPAGAGVFVRSEANFTLGINSTDTDLDYNGTVTNDDDTNFNLNQAGGAFVFNNQNMNTGWRNFVLAFNYERSNNIDRNYTIYDQNFSVSESDTIGFYYNGENLNSDGYSDKFNITFGTNYDNKLYLGGGLNFHTYYKEAYSYIKSEEVYLNDSNVTLLRSNDIDLFYDQQGTGFSLSLGAIFKATDYLRLGAAYHSPVWWDMEQYDNYFTVIDGERNGFYERYERYDYRSPSKFVGSVALVVGKNGAINIDYIYRDYGNSKYDDLIGDLEVNQTIDKRLTDVSEVRIGGEYRIENWRLRGGYRFLQNPAEDANDDFNTFSGGLGYNFGNTYFDFSVDHTTGSSIYTADNGDIIDQDLSQSNFTATLGFKF